MNQRFFTRTRCDRCLCSLGNGRTQSWFNTDVICVGSCLQEESGIRKKLKEKEGHDFEGSNLHISELRERSEY